MNKMTVIFASITALSILSVCSGQEQKETSEAGQFPSAYMGVVNVMTFNIRVDTFLDGLNGWNSRKQMVFDILSGNAADVIGLQEALHHQVEQIQAALPQYSNYAVGRNDGKQKGESCAIFYRTDKFVLEDRGTFWFSDTPTKVGSKTWGNLWPRICTWVHLINKETGAGFYVYNVHLAVFSQNAREKSAELLAKRIASRKTADPFIVMGDFNMKLDNPAMTYLLNTEGQTPYPKMTDAWQSAVQGLYKDKILRNFKGMPSGPKLDHIPLSDGLVALNVKVDRHNKNGRYPSDHLPVIAKIFLKSTLKKLEATAMETKFSQPVRD